MQYYIKLYYDELQDVVDKSSNSIIDDELGIEPNVEQVKVIEVGNKDVFDYTYVLAGYYKETGATCISKLPKGMKYFNTLSDAQQVVSGIDNGFVRGRDGHYHTCKAVIIGDSKREPPKYDVFNRTTNNGFNYNKRRQGGDEFDESAVDTFIRQNRSKYSEQTEYDFGDGFDIY